MTRRYLIIYYMYVTQIVMSHMRPPVSMRLHIKNIYVLFFPFSPVLWSGVSHRKPGAGNGNLQCDGEGGCTDHPLRGTGIILKKYFIPIFQSYVDMLRLFRFFRFIMGCNVHLTGHECHNTKQKLLYGGCIFLWTSEHLCQFWRIPKFHYMWRQNYRIQIQTTANNSILSVNMPFYWTYC